MSQFQEELFLFELAFRGIVWQGKSQNIMLIESPLFQNFCFFGHDIWAAVHEFCLHSQVGVTPAPPLLQSKRQKKTLKLTVLSGQWWKAVSTYPFCPLPGCASLAEFLWPLTGTHLPAHPGDWCLLRTCTSSECPGTAVGVFSPSLLRSVVLDALVYDFGNLSPRVKIQKPL